MTSKRRGHPAKLTDSRAYVGENQQAPHPLFKLTVIIRLSINFVKPTPPGISGGMNPSKERAISCLVSGPHDIIQWN